MFSFAKAPAGKPLYQSQPLLPMPSPELQTLSRIPSTRSMPRHSPLSKAMPTGAKQGVPDPSPCAQDTVPLDQQGIGLDLQSYADALQQEPEQYAAPLPVDPSFMAYVEQLALPHGGPFTGEPANAVPLQADPQRLQSYADHMACAQHTLPAEPAPVPAPTPAVIDRHSPEFTRYVNDSEPDARPEDDARRQHQRWPKPMHRFLQAVGYLVAQFRKKTTEAARQEKTPEPAAMEIPRQPDNRLQRTNGALADYRDDNVHRFADTLALCPANQRKDLIQACWDATREEDLFFDRFPLLVRAVLMTGDEDLKQMLTDRAIATLRNQQNYHKTHGRSGTTVFSIQQMDFLAAVGKLLENQELSSRGIYNTMDWLKAMLPRSERDAFEQAVANLAL